jgi:hypothetical protein
MDDHRQLDVARQPDARTGRREVADQAAEMRAAHVHRKEARSCTALRSASRFFASVLVFSI